ncbi:MAG: AzlD domain-containing protein [Anaerolineae bacterium]|jgi:branched-subunit amino acid transport protein|nr:AzlD domain-containing protein [Anaerolineae bacterium]
MDEILLIFGMTVVTFGARYPILALVGRMKLSPSVLRALRYVPPAVLSAIVAPALIAPNHQIAITPTNAYLIAGIVAIGIAAYRKNLMLTIGIGMIVFLVWRVIIGG